MADADTTLNQVFTGDPSKLLAAYKQVVAENIRLEQQTQKLAQTSKRGSETAAKGHQDQVSGLQAGIAATASLAATSLASFASISTVIQAATRDMENYQEQLTKARTAGLTVADAQAEIMKNMSAADSASRRTFVGQVGALGRELQFHDLAQFHLAAAEGLSAGSSPEEVLRSLRAAAPMVRGKPQELGALVANIGHLQRATGVEDADQLLQLALSTQGRSPISSLDQTLRNMAPAVLSAVATTTGDRAQSSIEAASLFATLGQYGGDVRGEGTRTAEIALATGLRSFFTEGVTTGTGRAKRTIKPAEDPGTIAGRLAILNRDPTLRQAFLDNANIEKQFQIPLEQLVSGGEAYQYFLEGIGRGETAIGFQAENLQQLREDLRRGSPQLRLADISRRAEGQRQNQFAGKTVEQLVAEAKTNYEQTLAGTDQFRQFGILSNVIRPMTRPLDEYVLKSKDAETQINTRIGLLREREQEILGLLPGDMAIEGMYSRAVERMTPEQRTARQEVFDAIAILDEIRETLKDLKNSNGEINDRDKAPKVGANPAANAQRGVRNER